MNFSSYLTSATIGPISARCIPPKLIPWKFSESALPSPCPYWGGGNIPDQYGRRSMDDDGETPLPPQPTNRHPMLANQWPPQDTLPTVDLAEVDNAIQASDPQKLLAAITNCNI